MSIFKPLIVFKLFVTYATLIDTLDQWFIEGVPILIKSVWINADRSEITKNIFKLNIKINCKLK